MNLFVLSCCFYWVKMITDPFLISGGWLLVSSVVLHSSTRPSQVPVKTSYRGISGKQMFLTTSAMKELRKHLPFTQLRFHCKKQKLGRTFHITTTANSKGEAVSSSSAVRQMLFLPRVVRLS